MSEILDAIRNMPPAAADWLVMLTMFAAGLGLGIGYAIWDDWRQKAKDDPPNQPTERRSVRRRWRDG